MNKLFYILLIVIFIFTGCYSEPIEQEEQEEQEEIKEIKEIEEETTSLEFEVDIKSGVDKYSVLMSSVPGLPVVISTKVYTDSLNLGLLVSTNYGEFNLWNADNTISRLGAEATFGFEDVTVYWTPLSVSSSVSLEKPTIIVTVYEIETSEVLDEIVGKLTKEDDSSYSVDFQNN